MPSKENNPFFIFCDVHLCTGNKIRHMSECWVFYALFFSLSNFVDFFTPCEEKYCVLWLRNVEVHLRLFDS